MKLSFRQRLFLYFAVLFSIFAVGIATFEYSRESDTKMKGLEVRLDIYANLIQSILSINTNNVQNDLQKFKETLPANLRITIIDIKGNVIYENAISNFALMENHSNRIEIITAKKKGIGVDIRESESNKQQYLYYAKKFDKQYVRVALPYDLQLKKFLRVDNLFLYFLTIMFFLTLFITYKITQQFGNSIERLRNFAIHSDSNFISFNDDELGEIGKQIAKNYHDLGENKRVLSLERQKLLQHIQISEEGICFISATKQVEFYNGLFILYLNQIVDDAKSDIQAILTDLTFISLHQFLENENENYFETKIMKQGKFFSLRANIFEDNSFEIILTDITKQEKTRQLKQEMTGNIAHELKTPITSIRAYLETILEQNLDVETKQHFTKQAYNQTLNLSEMIKDMSFIAKMEESPNSFVMEDVNIIQILENLRTEHAHILELNNIKFEWQLPIEFTIKGNLNLLISIFRNLLENCIRYAGENITVNFSMINQDKDFYYFSFYDTGVGVKDDSHLNRLFERFYRVQEGRTRETGGSGLGLSIVKNAILFHKGSITAKNKKEGGLEFLFTIKK